MHPLLATLLFFVTLPIARATSIADILERGSFLFLELLSNPWILTIVVFLVVLLLFNYLFLVGLSMIPTFEDKTRMQYAKKIALLLGIIVTIGLLGFAGYEQGRFSPRYVQERVSLVLSTFGMVGTWFLAVLLGAMTYFAGVQANKGVEPGIPFLRKFGLPILTFGLALWLGSSINGNQDSAGLGSGLALLGLIMTLIPQVPLPTKMQNWVDRTFPKPPQQRTQQEQTEQQTQPKKEQEDSKEKKEETPAVPAAKPEAPKEELDGPQEEKKVKEQLKKDAKDVTDMQDTIQKAQEKTEEAKKRLDEITAEETVEESKEEVKKEEKKEENIEKKVKKDAKREAQHANYLEEEYEKCATVTQSIIDLLKSIYAAIHQGLQTDDAKKLGNQLNKVVSNQNTDSIISITKKEVRKIRKLNWDAKNKLSDVENEVNKLAQHNIISQEIQEMKLKQINKEFEETQFIEKGLQEIELRKRDFIQLERHGNTKTRKIYESIIQDLHGFSENNDSQNSVIAKQIPDLLQIEGTRLLVLHDLTKLSKYIIGLDIRLENEIIQVWDNSLVAHKRESRKSIDDSSLSEQIERIKDERGCFYRLNKHKREIEDALNKEKYNWNRVIETKKQITLEQDVKDQILAALADAFTELKILSTLIPQILEDVKKDSSLFNYLRYDQKFYETYDPTTGERETIKDHEAALTERYNAEQKRFTELLPFIQNAEIKK
jgi:hypothetical protein